MGFLRIFLFVLLLSGCTAIWRTPAGFRYTPFTGDEYTIALWQKISNTDSPIHIYIEGDGHAFNGRGMPTGDPTPRGTFLRDLVASDTSPNVVYMARPCQYIMSDKCGVSDWTDGRFSPHIIESVASAIKSVSHGMPVILVGYSGGAMVSGLVIETHPEINVVQWITIAGVLNHSEWTQYFGDSPLNKSLDMRRLPNVPQLHYVAQNDETVPIELTQKMARDSDIIIVPNATHDDFGNLKLNFIN